MPACTAVSCSRRRLHRCRVHPTLHWAAWLAAGPFEVAEYSLTSCKCDGVAHIQHAVVDVEYMAVEDIHYPITSSAGKREVL